MKKHLIIFTAIFCVFAFDGHCQSIKDDPHYLRQLNYFWGITSAFAKVRTEMEKNSSKITTTRNEQIKVVTKLLERSKADFENLKATYSNDKKFKEIEELRMGLQASLKGLQDNKKTGPPLWQLTYILVQMNLEDKLVE